MNDNLNAIRLCLAMLVLFSHSFAVLGLPQPEALGWDLGSHAVHAFFAVSGYLVVGSYMRRPNLVQFALNRLLRIVPALLVAYVFGPLQRHLRFGVDHGVRKSRLRRRSIHADPADAVELPDRRVHCRLRA